MKCPLWCARGTHVVRPDRPLCCCRHLGVRARDRVLPPLRVAGTSVAAAEPRSLRGVSSDAVAVASSSPRCSPPARDDASFALGVSLAFVLGEPYGPQI